jgi:outer membrane cobalamin receptor
MHAMDSRWASNEHFDETCINGYAEVGLTASRKIIIRQQSTTGKRQSEVGVRLDIRNLFNRQYEIVSHYPMPGRSYQLTLNYKL